MDLQLLNSELVKTKDLFEPARKLHEIAKIIPEEITDSTSLDLILEMEYMINGAKIVSSQGVRLQDAEARIFLSKTYYDPNTGDDYI